MNYFRLLWNLYQQKQNTKKSVYDSFIFGEYLGWNAKNLICRQDEPKLACI